MRLYTSCAIQILVCLIETMETITTQVSSALEYFGSFWGFWVKDFGFFSAGSAEQNQTLAEIGGADCLR